MCNQRHPKNSIVTKFRKSIINRRCSKKKLFLKISQYSHENIYAGVSFPIKIKPSGLQLCQIETPTQVFSWQYCEIFKKSYFDKHLWTAAFQSFSFYISLNVFLHEQITWKASKEVNKTFSEKQNKKCHSRTH